MLHLHKHQTLLITLNDDHDDSDEKEHLALLHAVT